MHTNRWLAVLGAISLAVLAGCSDNFLTCSECTTDPNRPTTATSTQLFVGIEANTWAELLSDPDRITGMWAQQFEGSNFQYIDIYNYSNGEQVTNGFNSALYTGGGLVDIRRLETQTSAAHDSLFLGITQVMEGMLMGTGADLFGDLVYSHALDGPNPPLDPQLAVYDSVEVVLTKAIANLQASGPTNIGPGAADLTYGGDPALWTKLAHSLKARYYEHMAKARPTVWPQVAAEAAQGIIDPADNYVAVFSGASNQQNFWYQFDLVQRAGYLTPNPQFVQLLKSRNDPRLAQYFNSDQSDLNAALLSPSYSQPILTANQNLLTWAEAAYRTGAEGTARAELDAARALAGLGTEPGGLTGQALLSEILLEAYIADFQTIEAWLLYQRTCTPNLTPVVLNAKIPAHWYYDTQERQTNTSIPAPGQQPTRNPAVQPASATSDATGGACLGQ